MAKPRPYNSNSIPVELRLPMPKGLTIFAMVIAVLVIVLFSLDLAIQIPFRRANWLLDTAFVVSAIGLGFISWTTFKELK